MFKETVASIFSIEFMSSIAYALILVFAGFAVGKLAGMALFKLFNVLNFDKAFKNIARRGVSPSRIISSFISSTIYVVAVIWALTSLNIFYWSLIVVLYFILFLIVGAILFDFFYALPNLFAGFSIKRKKLLKIGQMVQIGNVGGEVIKIGFFNVRLNGANSALFLVPNTTVKKGFKIIN